MMFSMLNKFYCCYKLKSYILYNEIILCTV